MMRATPLIAVVCGLALHALLLAVVFALSNLERPDLGPTFMYWYNLPSATIQSFAQVAPGFLVGWMATHRGVVAGAVVGLGTAVISPILLAAFWGMPPFSLVLALFVGGAIVGVALNTMAAIAAQSIRARSPSNYAFKPTAGDALPASEPPGPAAA